MSATKSLFSFLVYYIKKMLIFSQKGTVWQQETISMTPVTTGLILPYKLVKRKPSEALVQKVFSEVPFSVTFVLCSLIHKRIWSLHLLFKIFNATKREPGCPRMAVAEQTEFTHSKPDWLS